MIKKIVVAYSGGLDTSVIVHWLKNKYKCEIIAFSADVGQGEDLEPLKKKAIQTGASRIYIEDLKNEFANEYILPAIYANAVYESNYFMATALSRPLIAKHLVKIALKEKADAIAHGCTGKGNDQVRLELAVMNLAPQLKILAPLRDWEMKSREEEMAYAKKYKIPVKATKRSPYSIDKNIWGVSIECGLLEDPWQVPPEDAYQMTKSPQKAPDKPLEIEIEFVSGVPVRLNNKKYELVDLIEELNIIGGGYGVGRTDMVENRLVGIKSREIYEAPAALIINNAHKAVESLTLDREMLHFKDQLVTKYSELIYFGQWFTPLREALDEFIRKTQKYVSGTVRLRLYKGNCEVIGRKSQYSLYKKDLATYDEGDLFDHRSAEGFVKLWGLPGKIVGMRDKKNG
ncbi:MAG: argininosuccinate synthase [bacterium]|nr:argininosuccinate synthase [bacterium]